MVSEAPPARRITVFLFDLGNVLLYFDQNIFLRRIAKHTSFGMETLKEDAKIVSLLHDYETGKFSSLQFFERLKETGLITDQALTFDAFVPMWSDIFWMNEEMVRFVSTLKGRYKLGMISNTNEMHISFAKEHFPGLFGLFDACIFSHETGVMKPGKEIYQAALNELHAPPEECIYIDDMIVNVEGARSLGIEGIHYVSMQGLLDVLRHMHLFGLPFPE